MKPRRMIITLVVCVMLSGCSTIGMIPTNRICPEVVLPTEEEQMIMRDYLSDFYIRYSEQQRQLYVCRYGKDPSL